MYKSLLILKHNAFFTKNYRSNALYAAPALHLLCSKKYQRRLFSINQNLKIPAKDKLNKHAEEEYDLQKKQKRATDVTKLGAVVNLCLAGCKSVIGLSVGSTALIGDAANSIGDILCDAVVYYSIVKARAAVSSDRPWGHGKLEPIGTLTVGGLLCLTGFIHCFHLAN